ncbi:MAG: hypothetical protein M3O28_08425 [Actinomycetota bacterium]|nr:hypothetical protein [Actinomycetota bacterium]
MTTSSDSSAPSSKRRTLGQQLNRSPRVMHASWLMGVATVMSASVGGGFSVGGILLLVVVFLPMVVAYRRDRLSLRIVFACLFLPAWPWAMYKAASRKPRGHGDAKVIEHSAPA